MFNFLLIQSGLNGCGWVHVDGWVEDEVFVLGLSLPIKRKANKIVNNYILNKTVRSLFKSNSLGFSFSKVKSIHLLMGV